MLKYMMKSLPAKYIYAGYSVRKGFTILTTQVGTKLVYDTFLFTYVDNYISFYIQMDDGTYRNVDYGVDVPETTAEGLVSKHITRGKMTDTEEYEEYDREKIVGVFGLRPMSVLIKQVDEMKKRDSEHFDVSLQAWLDVKPQYMGVEVAGVVSSFNKCLGYEKDVITVPPIKYGPEDDYVSLIGDEMDYFDFMSNKDSDTIIKELQILASNLDGIGNVKAGREVIITKGEDGEGSSLAIKKTEDE